MTTRKIRPLTPGVVAEGMFDQLPGAPWRAAPTGDYIGFAIPARETLRHYDNDETGQATFGLGDVELGVRVIGRFTHPASGPLRAVQFTGEEFEVLALLTEDAGRAHLSYRGSKSAFLEAAELLRVEHNKAMEKLTSLRASKSGHGL